jgi:hypothetical protein
MALKVTNNATSTLAGGINSSVTTIILAAGTGSLFPTLSGSDWFWGTLVDASNNIEIVKVTARSTDTLTVTRGQDGTTAKSYTVGDRFELRPTAALFNDKADIDNPSFTTKITTPAITLGTTALTATGAELNYVAGVTSAIQTQLDAKAPSSSPTLTNPTVTGTFDITGATLSGANPIVFEGATANAFETSITITDPTADRTITVPDADVDLTKVRAASTTLDGVMAQATTAESLAGTVTNKAVMPSGLSWPRSFGSSGYQKLPGTPGLIIQWGQSASIAPDANTTVTLPIAFPGAVLQGFCTLQNSDTGNDDVFARLLSITTNQITVRAEGTSGAVAGTRYINYLAVGY